LRILFPKAENGSTYHHFFPTGGLPPLRSRHQLPRGKGIALHVFVKAVAASRHFRKSPHLGSISLMSLDKGTPLTMIMPQEAESQRAQVSSNPVGN
ncbi:MAG: hypothetical protein IJ628_05530, partial [Bacteroidaceae bacterium]|nr:hypothetical protein [Bacteroidaceae bacterium]